MNIGIVGLGLIGGSIGLKLQKLKHKVYGCVNNISNEKIAIDRKLADVISCDYEILKNCELIILALPIKDLMNPSIELINSLPSNAVITDVGSIKEPIIKKWEKIHPGFIGSHPMAGNENKGAKAGEESLFENKVWIITPTPTTKETSIEKLKKLIFSMNCKIYETLPDEHDKAVSLISHLPIFLSSALIETANTKENKSLLDLSQKISSTGFFDTSRVGGGNPDLAVDLAANNQNNILFALNIYKDKLKELEDLIIKKDWNLLKKKLEESRQVRKEFCE
tara:strand:+ start:245 stop:1084 length:840 start_codon:yes stop_codon:yes gene_type:complete